MSALREMTVAPTLQRGFQLDGLRINPSTGEVSGAAGCETLDPKVMSVLVLLAQHAGEVVLREDLIARLWPNAVVTDDALSRCIYELRRQLSQAGGSERYRAMLETLPKRGYRLNGEPTPLGPETRSRPLNRPQRHVLAWGLAIAASIVVLVVVGQRLAVSPADRPPALDDGSAPSIAVLPFVDLSAGNDQAYLADGMAEEILNLLAKIPELRVISRNSAFAYRGSNAGLAEIASQLEVSHVLEGSVRKSGDRIRITTQLIDARSDSHLWSETYDRTLDDVFEVQDDIARQVVAQLKLELIDAVPRARRVDPQAYLNYVQARQLLEQAADGAATHALLQRALEIDPNYAQAWTGLHWLYVTCGLINSDADKLRLPAERRDEFCSRFDAAEIERRAQDALAKALALDPENPTAIAYQAMHAFWRAEWEAAARGFEHAARLDPANTDVLRPILFFTHAIRRPDLTIRIGEFVIERDPACMACLDNLARAYEVVGRLDEAEATIRAGKQSPHILARILLQQGAAQAALDLVKSAGFVATEDDRAWALHLESMALHSLGRQRESDAALATLESDFGAPYAHLISPTHAWKGDIETAARWLERHFETENGGPSTGQLVNPILQPVLRHPRIHPLLLRHGLAPEQLAGIKFDLKLPGGR